MSDTAKAQDTLDLALEDANDVRPVINTGSASNWGLFAFIAILALGGLVLFNSLNASREAAQGSGLAQQGDAQGQRIASPEPLDVPGQFDSPFLISPEARGLSREAVAMAPPVSLPPSVSQPAAEQPPVRVSRIASNPTQIPAMTPPQQFPLPPIPEPVREPVRSQVVYERRPPQIDPEQLIAAAESGVSRVKATRLENPSLTIPQGTVIPAVLETALDSTRGGGVRALVQRNVMGFDGKKVLIPRGSQLYGEYQADLRRGQNRALVQWTRLIRPDGVTIALDSPSSDPLGRAGVKGKVDSKFFERFGNALLQSVLDIGVGLAVNTATDGVIVALPGSTQNVQVNDQGAVLPTLKVRHGTRVSVFVARDLDFSSVDS